jgi:hypothetical protein
MKKLKKNDNDNYKKPFKITKEENENRSEMDNSSNTIFNFVSIRQFVRGCAIHFGDISHKSVIQGNIEIIVTLCSEKGLRPATLRVRNL